MYAKTFCRNHYQQVSYQRITTRKSPAANQGSAEDILTRDGWDIVPTGCWHWRGNTNRAGYGTVSAKRFGFHYAHRLSYFVYVGDFDRSLEIRHQCHNPICINPQHLLPGTRQENEQDKTDAGRRAVGQEAPRAKLTDADVSKIRYLYSSKEYLQKDLALLFSVSPATICNVVNNKYWSIHV